MTPKTLDTAELLEVWKVLENLTVSLDRLGLYQLRYGEAGAMHELHRHLSPELVRRIAHARRLTVDALTRDDPDMLERLEQLAEDEAAIGYWTGPT
ncbi:hypothetical protein [Deinococcus radiophilus]|uniref:Uncharacterized protein n=1 Tax=Deinococcus radiophilus TaxID=32062 RepID=A0A431W0Q4_9DEIO|nr:hypothetical protein [Deinococcus radiophilus]RTR29005.1 hypothetical protein EJ104_03935 [Deinococcus radiophilus]UFA49589.1 hypothetical protein LMT64_06685 [Deinococcus radiophilus]